MNLEVITIEDQSNWTVNNHPEGVQASKLEAWMDKLGQDLDRISKQVGFQPGWETKLTTKLYQSAFLFHAITAFKISNSSQRMIPFAYDNGQTLTEAGYIMRHLGRKYPHVMEQVDRYRQHPEKLASNLKIKSSIVKHFAERLFTIQDVRYSEVNLDTTNDTFHQLAMDIVMFADLINSVLTRTISE